MVKYKYIVNNDKNNQSALCTCKEEVIQYAVDLIQKDSSAQITILVVNLSNKVKYAYNANKDTTLKDIEENII